MGAFIIWALKICLAVFYSRLTNQDTSPEPQVLSPFRVSLPRNHLGRRRVDGSLFVLAAVEVSADRPRSRKYYLCQPGLSRAYIWVYFVAHIVTDFYLLLNPSTDKPAWLPWKGNVTLRRKTNLASLFSGGIFTVVATIVRTTNVLSSCLEIFISIFVTNAPVLYPPENGCTTST
ncbi:hypothetical protein GGR53DRAFT_527964 [Hypoxylon sp. FL1150]|nr:hypothetical protein GGR53DRAFT_527964 [Hypoxylon sp. FL1150]